MMIPTNGHPMNRGVRFIRGIYPYYMKMYPFIFNILVI